MAYPPITSLGTVPQRTQTPSEFATNADSCLGALPNFRTELNTFGAYVDAAGASIDSTIGDAVASATAASAASATAASDSASAASTSASAAAGSATASASSATSALAYKDLAASNANFKGLWSSLNGALNVPAMVYHNGIYWNLTANLSNVTTAQPGVSASWIVANGDSFRRTVDNLFARATLDLNFANNSHRVYEQFGLEPKQLQSAVLTTRNSTATHQTPTGISTAAINTPRITYDAATGNALGLLVEEQRTRLNTASANVTASQNATVTAAAHTISFYGTGSVVLTGAHSATLVGAGSGRVTLTFTPTAGALTMTPSGTVTDLQLELGAFASTIIRGNEGSQVTRLAAFTTIPNLAELASTLTDYTIVIQGKWLDDTVAFGFGNTFDNCIYISSKQFNLRSSGAAATVLSLPHATDTSVKIAVRVKSGDFAAAVNGAVTGTSSSSIALPVGMVRATIGNAPWESSVTLANSASGTFSRITFIPRGLTNAELQAITA